MLDYGSLACNVYNNNIDLKKKVILTNLDYKTVVLKIIHTR